MLVTMLALSTAHGHETPPPVKPISRAQTKEQRDQNAALAEAAVIANTLSHAKTAALVVHATSTVSCPEGAPGDCIRNDGGTISQVEGFVDQTDLWSYFEKADATQADLILDFQVKDTAMASFSVRDSDSNKILYSEYRQVVSLDNDVNRMIAHFLTNLPKRSEAERQSFTKRKQCSELTARYNADRIAYEGKVKDYNWKNSHQADGIMNECEQHWKDYVCLDASAASQTHGRSIYSDNWNQSIVEFDRKLKLEYDELAESNKKLEGLKEALNASACTLPASQ